MSVFPYVVGGEPARYPAPPHSGSISMVWWRRVAVGAAQVSLLAAGMTGCYVIPEPVQGGGTAIVVATSKNELAPTLSADTLARVRQAGLDSTADSGLYVVAAGRARIDRVDVAARRPNGEPESNPARRAVLVDARLLVLHQAVQEATTEGQDNNLLRALDAAAHTGAPRIEVLAGGVETNHPINLNAAGFDRDPATIAAELRAAGELPDLRRREVRFSGLGRTAPPQSPLGVKQQAWLRQLWLQVCAAAGGRCSVDDSVRSADPNTSTVTAPIVPVPTATTVRGPTGPTTYDVPGPLMFAPDSCDIDRAAAVEALRPVAEVLADGETTVTISGRTAPVGPGTGHDLARCRAQAAADVLRTDLRVPDRLIAEVRGDGSTADPPEASRDPDGRLDPAKLPALRRTVFIFNRMTGVTR